MKVVKLSASATPQDISLELISVGDWVDPRAMVRPEGLSQWKIPSFTIENETTTFRLVTYFLRAGKHYPHVTWARVMLRVQLGCERRFNIEFYGADSHFCYSAYVTWSHVEIWSAHASARLSHFCCRIHFVRRDQRVECSRADQSSTWDHVT